MYKSNYKKGSYNTGFVAPRIANQIANVAATQAVRKQKIIDNNRYKYAPYGVIIPRANRGTKTEVKTVDTAVTLHYTVDGTVAQTMQLLNTIAQDASPTGRVGKKVTMTGVALRGTIFCGTALNVEKATTLLVYVRNNNQAATLPAWAEILVSQSNNALTNRDNASKFKIIRRWDHALIGDSDSATTTSATLIPFEEFIKFKKPLEACWTAAGTAGTIGQFEKGSLILCTVGSLTEAGTHVSFSGNSRVYFTDA